MRDRSRLVTTELVVSAPSVPGAERLSSLVPRALASAFVLALASCGVPRDVGPETGSSEAEIGEGLAPNDVSVLLPFARGQRGFRRLPPLAGLLPSALFEQVTSAARRLPEASHFNPTSLQPTEGIWATALELPVSGPSGPTPLGAGFLGNWRVVSFRFDPCAPPAPHVVPVATKAAVVPPRMPPEMFGASYDADADRANVERCVVELRVVAQPFRVYEPEEQARDGDTTMHLFFRYGEPGRPDVAARDEIVRTLRALKKASPAPTGGELRVHPGLVADRDGAFATVVGEALRSLARRGALSQIAFMGLRDPVLRAFEGRGADGGSNMWNFFVGRVDGDRFEQLDVETTWAWTTRTVDGAPRYVSGPESAQVVDLATDGEGRVRITPGARTPTSRSDIDDVDTRRASPRSADCASCHFRGGRDTRLVNFGYVGGSPSIATRTARETDVVVRTITEALREP